LTFAQHIDEFRDALRTNARRYEIELSAGEIARLGNYYELLLAWNPRLHLVAPCSPTEFAMRHVLESLLLLPHFSADARVADVGSGAGLPIIPSLIARPDIHAVLIESSQKKAVFLREALRTTGTSERSQVIARRFEDVPTPEVNTVTCRALDRFSELLPTLIDWAPHLSTLLLFGGEALQSQMEKFGLNFSAVKIPASERRWLFAIDREF
jgi:16S rRNA (guanine527-N7)-methyltransferase